MASSRWSAQCRYVVNRVKGSTPDPVSQLELAVSRLLFTARVSLFSSQTWNQCNDMLLTSLDKKQSVLLMDTETGETLPDDFTLLNSEAA